MFDLDFLSPYMPDDQFEEWIDRGKPVGARGTTRIAYAMRGNNSVVIKEMRHLFPRANIVEWVIWEALVKMADDYVGATPNPNLQKLFAKCYTISESGKFLVMERLDPLGKEDPFPRASFPAWLNDIKPAGFGEDASFGKDAHGRVKCMDYADINFYEVLNPLNTQRFF